MNKVISSNRFSYLLIGLAVILFGAVVGIQVYVEKKVNRQLSKIVMAGDFVVDYTLVTNQLSIKVPDSLDLLLPFVGSAKVKSGRIDLCGFKYFQYTSRGAIKLSTFKIKCDSLSFTRHDTQDLTSDTIDSQKMINRLEVQTGFMSLDLDSTNIQTHDLDMTVLDLDLSTKGLVTYAVDRLSSGQVSIRQDNIYEFSVKKIASKGGNRKIIISNIRFLKGQDNPRSRIIVNAQCREAVLHDFLYITMTNIPAARKMDLSGLNLNIDQIEERPFCDGRKPCEQAIISDILFEFPFRDTLMANGSLTFRHFKNGLQQNTLPLTNFDCELHRLQQDTTLLLANIDAIVNREINARLSGRFFSNKKFQYDLCAENFNMEAMNPFIPAQMGRDIIIEKGFCEKFCFSAHVTKRFSKAQFNIEYDDLSFDIANKEGLGDRLLKGAVPLMVNKSANIKRSLTHEHQLPVHRSFFYQLGEHVNYGFQNAVVKSWARKKEEL